MKKNQKEIEKVQSRVSLNLLFSAVIFVVLLTSLLLSAIVVYVLANTKIITYEMGSLPDLLQLIIIMGLVSLFIGIGLSFATGHFPLKPIKLLITQMNRLSSGDFKARLHFGRIVGAHPAFREIQFSFNKMAGELESTELVSSDFINNFSHEFKTPIVSIAGFANLLRREDLTEAQKQEYITAIEEESRRLSYMATNILNLSKVEKQSILTDVTEYNVSEQIRSVFLLLEGKWSDKNLEIDIDLPEVNIEANEELMKQVWINLIDNAVKFTPEYSPVKVEMTETSGGIIVEITNPGDIPEEAARKIWNKFYQADESHSKEGNGVGLAIVKRIITLHNGSVNVKSKNGAVTFTVVLPKKH